MCLFAPLAAAGFHWQFVGTRPCFFASVNDWQVRSNRHEQSSLPSGARLPLSYADAQCRRWWIHAGWGGCSQNFAAMTQDMLRAGLVLGGSFDSAEA